MTAATLTLILPALLPSAASGLPALESMLTRGARLPGLDAEGALCAAFGLTRQQDWPLAPLLARQDGLETGRGYWLCCDPVRLEAGMNGLILHRGPGCALAADEAAALAAAAAAELALHWPGASLHVAHPSRWYVRLEQTPDLTTHASERAFHLGVGACLPTGADARRAMRLLNAVQTALHEHPVNQRREASGLDPINSVWLWGGGSLPQMQCRPDRVLGGEGVRLAALAACEPFPDALPALRGNVVAFAPPDWPGLDATWLRPLLRRLRWTRLRRLRLAFVDAGVELTPRDVWLGPQRGAAT